MPTLPEITVTDAQYKRLAAILPGATAAEKSAAYVKATKQYWRDQIVSADVRAAEAEAAALIEAAQAAANDNPDNMR